MAAGDTTPSASTPTRVTSQPSRSRKFNDSAVAGCSANDETKCLPFTVSAVEKAAPFNARLTASLPLAVKIISSNRFTPNNAQNDCRAPCTARPALAPSQYKCCGKPNSASKNGNIAARAPANNGVVAK